MNKFTVTLEGRIDNVMSEALGITRSQAKNIIENGVKVNEICVTKAGYKVKVNDEIIYDYQEKPKKIEAKDIKFDVVYEDGYLLIVNKPRGLVVHPAHGHIDDTLANGLSYRYDLDAQSEDEDFRMGIVHRIDKDTSGLLVVAKTPEAKEKLSSMVAEHLVEREYLCLAYGYFKDKKFKVDAPIGRAKNDRQKMAVDVTNGKRAITHFEVLKQYREYALVKCMLETGRTHQIRVHLSYIGHPLIGDGIYTKRQMAIADKGQLLHAYKLSFVHPFTGKKMSFYAPIDEYFKNVISAIAQM